MTLTRNHGLAILVAGLAAALLLYRTQSAEWAQYAPAWHKLFRDGDLTVCALLVALLGLFFALRR